jgi:hypothetical protein
MPTILKTFDLVGKAEEVSDVISLIAPSDTPFLSSIKTEAVSATLYQWMEDQLRAVAKNAKLEAADPTDSNRDQPSMRSNGTQILEETFKVSGTAEAIKTYGRDKQAAREMMKTGKLLKMDLEYSLVGNAQTYVAATASVAGEFASVQAQISATTTTTVDTNGATAGTIAGPLTEADLIATHQKLYNAGSDGSVLMIKPSDSVVIAGWSQLSGRTRELGGEAKSITNVVNVYESPFGTVRVVKNRWMKATDAIIVDPSNWKLAVLRNWFKMNLAKTGDADRYSMIGEFGLKHTNRAATALITNLT